jgi:hypothetical protein
MSKLNCLTSLKSQLASTFAVLISAQSPNVAGAQAVQAIVNTADNIDNGFWEQIAPFYDPLTPKFMLAVKTLNEEIISGATTAVDFDAYIKLLAAALQA